MPVKAVQIKTPPLDFYAREIVIKTRTHVGAGLDHFRLRHQPLVLPTEITRDPRAEVITEGEEYFRAKGLQQGPPALARQCRLERTQALRGDNRDALALPRQTEAGCFLQNL